MVQQLSKQQMFVADFETCDDLTAPYKHTEYDGTDKLIYDQKVWLAGHKNLETMESVIYQNLDDFMVDILGPLGHNRNARKEVAFHNLKFDGSFMLPWLFKNGYSISEAKTEKAMKVKDFTVLIDERNNWYNIKVKCTSRRFVLFWDLLKLFPVKLAYLHDVYATPTQKIKEDTSFYEGSRGKNHVLTTEEKMYFENDLQVPAETLNAHIDFFGYGFKKTQASQSFHNFKQRMPHWKLRYPPLENDIDAFLRMAYVGGIAHASDDYKYDIVRDVVSYDINSSYPYQASHMYMPQGDPVHEKGDIHPPMSRFWVAKAVIQFKLKKDCLPCIARKQIIGWDKKHDDSKWMYSSPGLVTIYMSSIDYVTIHESYDFEIVEWLECYHFKQAIQPEIRDFILENNETKVKHKQLYNKYKKSDPDKARQHKVMSDRAKIDNNSFYGKFAEEVIKYARVPEEPEDNKPVQYHINDGEEMSDGARKYLAIAIAITALGRQQLVRMANLMGPDFCYCDTDSVHGLKTGEWKILKAANEGLIELDSTKLGAWDKEGDFKRAKYLRAKCYMEEKHDGDLEVTCAGLPADPGTGQYSKKRSCLTFSNFNIGYEVPLHEANKLRSIKTPNGTKLLPVAFKIKQKLIGVL